MKKVTPREVQPKEFFIDCNILDRVAKATFEDDWVSGGADYGDYDIYPDYDVEVYLKCECGESHTWKIR